MEASASGNEDGRAEGAFERAVEVYRNDCVESVHYAALGYDGGPLTTAEKLALVNAARAKNINIVD